MDPDSMARGQATFLCIVIAIAFLAGVVAVKVFGWLWQHVSIRWT